MGQQFLTPIEMQAVKGRLRSMLATRQEQAEPGEEQQAEMWALEVAIRAVENVRRVAAKRQGGAKSNPLPFSVPEALDVLHTTSQGRFLVTNPGRAAIAIQSIIRRYPDQGVWRRVGEWLGAGGESYRGTLDSRALTWANFDAWAMVSQDWDEKGRPALTGRAAEKGYVPEDHRWDKDPFKDEEEG